MKSWEDLEEVDFMPYAICLQMEQCISKLKKLPKIVAKQVITPTCLFAELRTMFEVALWSEIGNVISRCGGPPLPATLTIKMDNQDEFEEFELSFMHLGYTHSNDVHEDDEIMVSVLTRCVMDRMIRIRQHAMAKPKDWWLNLVFNDVVQLAFPWPEKAGQLKDLE
jgi:hypothetical protein